MIHYAHFRKYAVWPVVQHFPNPVKAASLLMHIAAHESVGGQYMQQIKGPAMGPYQFEPPTKKLVDRWVRRRDKPLPMDAAYLGCPEDELRTDLKCATWYARVLLLADPKPLPPAKGDPFAQYNTYLRVWRPGKPPTFIGFQQAHERWIKA